MRKTERFPQGKRVLIPFPLKEKQMLPRRLSARVLLSVREKFRIGYLFNFSYLQARTVLLLPDQFAEVGKSLQISVDCSQQSETISSYIFILCHYHYPVEERCNRLSQS